jgi:hypothetical protein
VRNFGIASDQSRGPSKKGTIGFPLGGSQPFFPLDDLADPPRYLDVLEVNMLTQDLVIVCPAEYGRQLLDSAARHHGVAHFLFHPAHILKPGVAEALGDLLQYGRSQGIEWWTSEQIYRWEKRRRGITAQFASRDSITLKAREPLDQATLLVLKTQDDARPLTLGGQHLAALQLDVRHRRDANQAHPVGLGGPAVDLDPDASPSCSTGIPPGTCSSMPPGEIRWSV